MEIQRWLLCVVINCAIVSHLVAKPVSLNELIAAEAKQKLEQHTKSTESKHVSLKKLAAEREHKNKKSPSPKSTIKTAKTVSLNELIAAESKQKDNKYQSTDATTKTKKESSPSESRQKFEKNTFFLGWGLRLHRSKFLPTLSHKPFESAENIFSLARTITPLKFRKRFEIRPPLKPKKLKYSFTPRLRRNQSTKREANENALFDHRHIPLIKRIGLLVDNILSPNSGESLQPIRRRKPRRKKLSGTTDLTSSESKPQKRQLLLPLLSHRRPLTPRIPRVRLPTPQPILLPLVTSTLSDQIRTYHYHLQEIPAAIGETIMESVREAAPHFTETLRDISPGIMEVMNIIPTDEHKPIHHIMRKIPIALHESMNAAMDTGTELIPEIETTSTKQRKQKLKTQPTASSEEMTLTQKLRSKLEGKRYKYQETYEDYQDYPIKSLLLTQNPYRPKNLVKKASSMSHSITPVLNEGLTGMAQLPQKIKDFVKSFKE